MISEFVSFVKELFPSINPYTKEQVRSALKQFETSGQYYRFFLNHPFDFLAQGDIIESLPFIKYDKFGNQSVYKTKGMLLSNTCDAENDDVVVFAPLIPLDKLKLNKSDVANNLIYRLLYFPDSFVSNYVVDLSLMNSFSKDLIVSSLEGKKLNKVASLNDFGYYLFLSKLTVHMMRPEDESVQKDRAV